MRSVIEHIFLSIASAFPCRLGAHILKLLRTRPDITDRWGHHIRPIHYYEPLPDFQNLSVEELTKRQTFPSIDFDLASQIRLMTRLSSQFRDELQCLQSEDGASAFDFYNDFFGRLDAAVYYSMIRDVRPRRLIEIGSGFSTLIALRALERNRLDGVRCNLTCIEPYPGPQMQKTLDHIHLIDRPVQAVPLSTFEQLTAGDILFIDSTHVVATGSDVNFEVLKILPALQKGVIVHFHDIFFPYEDPSYWLMDKRISWNEQYLLQAFLSFNSTYRPMLANAWLWHEYREVADLLFSSVKEGLPPASFWMTRAA